MMQRAFLIALLTCVPHFARAELTNRWSFDGSGSAPAGTVLTDSVGSEIAYVRGNGSTFTGTQLTLTGTTNGNQTAANISGYVDLPNGIVSSKTSITLEAWATPITAKNWMRVFDLGRVNTAGVGGGAAGEITGTTTTAPGGTSASDNIMLSFDIGTNIAQQRMEAALNGGSFVTRDANCSTTLGQQYHYVLTFAGGVGPFADIGGMLTWYRDGVVMVVAPVPYRLANLEDVNNWLGRSMWSGDSNANASFNEFRIYDHAMTPEEVVASRDAGPDALWSPPAVTAVPAQPVNRWSFNETTGTNFIDTIGGATATVRGAGATLSGTALTLPGGTNGNQSASAISAYVDLPNNIVNTKPNFTAEAWCAPLSSRTDQRLFDFGRSTITSGAGAATGEVIDGAAAPGNFDGYDNLVLSLNSAATFGKNRIEGEYNNAGPILYETDLSTATTAGTEYHYVLTVEDGVGQYGGTGSRAKWYRNGVLQHVLEMNFRLSQISDVNNWIGRSAYSGDMNAHLALNELRIYNGALTPTEVMASYNRGTDTTFGPAVTQADTATIHAGQKVRVPVLANDTGSIDPATVEIVTPPAVGTATPDSSGRILYAHAGTSTTPVTFTYRVLGFGGYSAPTTVTVNISTALRIANPGHNVPASPPPTAVQIVPAFGNLSFTKPLAFASPPGDAQRLFVCEIGGLLKVVPDVTASAPTSAVVLDIPTMLANRGGTESIVAGPDGECGLLGLAFHPNFASNGYFYVHYSVRKASDNTVWYQRLSRFTIPTAQIGSPTPVADANSESMLLEQRDRIDNHNGGDIHFGPDGYLYTAYGDEANANDYLNNSQKIDGKFFSAMMRIDVDRLAGNLEPNPAADPANTIIPTDSGVARYKVPADNPWVGATTFNGVAVNAATVRSEFWAVGLRSPWRFSFDSATGELWCGDVGQDIYEEVHLIEDGGNYGWAYRDGAHPGPKSAQAPPGFIYTDPIYEYVHNSQAGDSNFKGNSITGGVVYRGTRFSSLVGAYIFGDHVSGNIWALTRPGGVTTVGRIAGSAFPANFGTDPSNGDVLLSSYFTGTIMRLITTTPAGGYPATLSATELFADVSDLSPAPGLLPYTPNLTFWSDYAVKRRWFMMPDLVSTMTWSKDSLWTLPGGMIWVKHFDMEMTRGVPATKKRIETRVLVRNAGGVYGVSYKWNEAQTEAALVSDGGDDFDLAITDGGLPYTQHWHIPSRTECVSCHTPQGGHALSFTTRQLNCTETINGFTGNQLTLLRDAGFFGNSVPSANVLPRHVRPDETAYPVEARARSYLAVNCAYCHLPGGSGPSWDGRPELTLAVTGLINGNAAAALDPNDKLIVPGDTLHSVMLSRIAATNGYTRMPPLATSELDQTGIALLSDWIANALPTQQTYAQWRLAQFGSSSSSEGAPTFDADGDGRTNEAEFLALTNPLSGASFLTPLVSTSLNTATFSFDVPANRSGIVETSLDLATWWQWDVPGNDGLPLPGGSVNISGPMLGTKQFFRLRLQGN
ncbi:MAG: LamG-like jellyroll fold domain-containing protein [Chthoniobacteraceae bacterium]